MALKGVPNKFQEVIEVASVPSKREENKEIKALKAENRKLENELAGTDSLGDEVLALKDENQKLQDKIATVDSAGVESEELATGIENYKQYLLMPREELIAAVGAAGHMVKKTTSNADLLKIIFDDFFGGAAEETE